MKKILIGLLALTLNASAAYKIQTQGVKTSAECIAAGATDATCLIKDSQIYSSGLAGRLDQAITAGTLGSKLTTKGDLQTFSTANVRLPVGTNGQVLTADSGTATGLAWGDASGGGGSIENLIVNPTAELTSKAESATWTCTNATVAYDTGTYASPTRSWKITATSAGGYCETSFTTLAGRVNHDGYFYYKTTASDVTIGAYLGTNLQNSATLAAKSAVGESSHVTFVTDGTAQSGKLRVTMPTDTTVIYIDDLYAGANQNIGSVAQNFTDWTPYTPTFENWGTATNVSFLYRRVGNFLEVDGAFTSGTVADGYASISFPSTYEMDISSGAGYSTGTTCGRWDRGLDGPVHNGSIICSGSDSTTKVWFSWAFTSSVSALTRANASSISGDNNAWRVHFRVPVSSLSSQTAVRVGAEAGFAKAFFNTNAYWLSSATSPTFPTGKSGATFSATNSGITMSSISDGTGLQPGATITVDTTGWYNACWTSSVTSLSNGQGSFAKLVYDDTTDIVKGPSITSGTTTPQAPLTLCGDFYVSSAGSHTIKVLIWTTGGTGTRLSDGYGDDNASPTLSVKKLTQSIPQPVIVNSKFTGHSGQTKDYDGALICSNPPSIIGDGVSIARDAAGKCTITFDRTCKEEPFCTYTGRPEALNRFDQPVGVYGAGSTTTSKVWVYYLDAGGAPSVSDTGGYITYHCSCRL